MKDYFLTAVSKAFLDATNETLDLYHEQDARVDNVDEFSIILLEIYQNFMLDIVPSCQLLVDQGRFYSYAILCRSALDIIIQIKWILSLDDEGKEAAIKKFLNFEGIGTDAKGRRFYEWQNEMTRKSTREIAIELKLDREVITLQLANHEDKELGLTAFDYLSKVTHWNPRLINDLVGFSQENHVGHTPEYLRMAVLSLEVFVGCIIIFTEIFMEQCLKLDGDVIKNKTNKVRVKFQQVFESFYRESHEGGIAL